MALAAPGYPAYRNILSALGLEPVLIEVGANANYQPNPELLAEAGDIAGLIVASPANPTGTMIPRRRTGAACRMVPRARHPARFGRDLSRHHVRDAGGRPPARIGSETIVVNSFSKYYSMTGWRLGWMLVPPELARSIECLAQNFYVSPPTLSQLAAHGGVRVPRRT